MSEQVSTSAPHMEMGVQATIFLLNVILIIKHPNKLPVTEQQRKSLDSPLP